MTVDHVSLTRSITTYPAQTESIHVIHHGQLYYCSERFIVEMKGR